MNSTRIAHRIQVGGEIRNKKKVTGPTQLMISLLSKCALSSFFSVHGKVVFSTTSVHTQHLCSCYGTKFTRSLSSREKKDHLLFFVFNPILYSKTYNLIGVVQGSSQTANPCQKGKEHCYVVHIWVHEILSFFLSFSFKSFNCLFQRQSVPKRNLHFA